MSTTDKIAALTHFITEPFAVYQDRIRVYQSSKMESVLTDKATTDILSTASLTHIALISSYKTYLFVVSASTKDTTYTLLIHSDIPVEEDEKTIAEITTEEQFQHLQKNCSIAASILSCNDALPVKSVTFKKTENTKRQQPTQLRTALPDMVSEQLDFTDNYELEKIFFKQLKSGNYVAIQNILKNILKVNTSKLAEDDLTSKKYRLICFIALLTREAIKDGCPATIAYRLSDRLIRQIDKIQEVHDIRPFLNNVVTDFSLLIKSHQYRYKSVIVNNAIEFIYRNLYHDFNNEDIATDVSVNAAYLSSLFKRETGHSLKKFIHQARINESKYLLANTDLSLKEIAEQLHFSNQSHFCKIFKQETNYSPKEYRILFT